MTRIQLADGETMAQHERKVQFQTDCMNVAMLIHKKPGIPSRWHIGQELGLTTRRVAACIGEINEDASAFLRVEYEPFGKEPKGGPYAGQKVRGWFSMKRAAYHDVMGRADEHASLIEVGVRKNRAYRLVAAKREFSTAAAAKVVDQILHSLDLDPAKMTKADWDALFELAMEAPVSA